MLFGLRWTGTRAARGRCWRKSWHVNCPAFKYLRVFLCFSFSCVVLFLASRERARSRLTGLPRRGRTFHQQTMHVDTEPTRSSIIFAVAKISPSAASVPPSPAFHRHLAVRSFGSACCNTGAHFASDSESPEVPGRYFQPLPQSRVLLVETVP